MSKTKKRALIFFAISLIALIMMTYQYNKSQKKEALNSVFREVLSYPFDAFNSLIASAKAIFNDHWNAVEENKKLKREISTLLLEMQDYGEIVRENQRLREILSLKPQRRDYVAAARAISRGNDRLLNTIILDKGENEGIRKDMAVITTKGLVGKIYAARNGFSEVLLINDPNFSVAVRLQNNRQEGVLSGTGRKYCALKYISSEDSVDKGDMVVTSGLDGIIPSGLPVGIVIDVKKDEADFFQDIKVMPFQSIDKIEEVVILKR